MAVSDAAASAAAEPQLLSLRHELLRVTDRALGAEAAEAQLRAELDALRGVQDALRVARAERDALGKRIVAMRRSTTWRVGRALLAPVARVTGRRRR